MRIVVDLDGTICTLRKKGETYADVQAVPGAKETLKKLREQGHEIVIHTGRHMRTTGHNVGKVLAKQGKITLDWLEENGIEYDEIHFGRPNAEIYICDRSVRFENWDDIDNDYVEKWGRDQ